ncbi:MAG: hypothetical protein NT040_10870 [Bacteroidetes bacterium]|nr:hypothetical protein [Bacteroidota bacterium]
MKNHFVLTALLICISITLMAQVGINSDNSLPDGSAMLDVKSSTKGVLLPRLTYDQRNAINTPAEGLMVFCTDCGVNGTLSVYSNNVWRTFSPCISPMPVPAPNTITPGQITWNWVPASGAMGYKWGSSMSYSSATDLADNTSTTETGILCGATYTRYLWSYSACGISDRTTLTQSIATAIPDIPAAATHEPAKTAVVWNWHPASGATGYKWNTEDDFSTATNVWTDTTMVETNLPCETSLTRYVWAYNGCGYSTPVTLTQSTLNCWTCGDPFTISHVTGAVAPVDKTVNYGTVTNIPGELTKCWITRNLGASQQATAVNDATEASAGWYWQFNRKQGYMHDGATRTPNSTWNSNINESSDWITANDPCNLELGTAWRIPTYTEWYNVANIGVWTSWAGPWDSGLKMHAAGYLLYSDGSLNSRGSYGYYWSSEQYGGNTGMYLYFRSIACAMGNSFKGHGYSIRCLRDF